jgi:synaptojanin
VLWKGAGLKQIDYRSASLKISDHRPVLSLFDCTISIVDETQKEKLNQILYDQHRSERGTMAAGNLLDDDDDLLSPSTNSLGLPPPSSDRQKWWLDNGKTLALIL